MTPEERIQMAELHDLYDKHTPVWCDPSYNTPYAEEGSFCSDCKMPLFKRANGKWDVGVGLKDRRLMLSMNRPFAKHLGNMRDTKEAADIMAALLLWHIRVQGMENPPMYYCSLAAQIGADSPDFRRVIRDCGGWLAYDWLANFRDEEDVNGEMRAAALKEGSPRIAYNMAIYIDLEPRQDTWDIVKTGNSMDEFESYERWKGYPRYKHIVLK